MLDYSICHVVSFFIALIVGALTLVLSGFLFSKYRKNPSKLRLYISLVVCFLALAMLIDPIIFLYTRLYLGTIAEADRLISNQTAWSFALIGIANVFMVLFLSEVFFEKQSKRAIYIFAAIQLVLIVVLPISAYLEFEVMAVYVVDFLVSLYLYFNQLLLARNLSQRLSKEKTSLVQIRAIQSIGLSGILLIAAFLCFVLQEFSGDLGLADALGCSFFIPTGWVAAGLAAFSYYVGYFMPEWFKKRYETQ